MKLVRNPKGMTLVELLAVIVILSIITVLSMQVFTNGMSFSDKESSKATLQQQYNYILTVWRETHEAGNPYQVTVSADQKGITFTQYDRIDSSLALKVDKIQDSRFSYELTMISGLNRFSITEQTIDPKVTKNIEIEIDITNLGKGTPSYKANTVLSRL